MSWHVPDETLRVYLTRKIADADAWSVEAHVTSCERCRDALAAAYRAADPQQATVLDNGWTSIASRLSAQGKVHPGTRWREARVLVAGGPGARRAWLAACALVLVFAAVLGGSGVTQTSWLGIVAPLVPVLGVAASYGSGLDDALEVIASTPGGGLRLLLIRSAVVLAVTTPIALVAGVVIGYGSPVPWLLASLALTLITLAVGSAIGIERAAAAVGLAWVVAISGAAFNSPSAPPVLLTHDAVPAMLAAIAMGAVVVAVRRGSFNELPAHHRTRSEATP